MISLSPIAFLLALWMAFLYGLLYLLFIMITGVFQNGYGWKPEIYGLVYIGIGLGFFFLGLAAITKISDGRSFV